MLVELADAGRMSCENIKTIRELTGTFVSAGAGYAIVPVIKSVPGVSVV
jgi:hypothetical protein